MRSVFSKQHKERLTLFGLEIEPTKTRLLEFGRFAEENKKNRGQKKPETFVFLGFTHYCSKSRNGKFRLKRKTSQKKFVTKLKAMNQWLKQNRHLPLRSLIGLMNSKLRGHYQYYGITDNYKPIENYYYRDRRMLFKWLNRRSQRKSYTWEGYEEILKVFPLFLPKIRVNIFA
jgi:hypothetical protein